MLKWRLDTIYKTSKNKRDPLIANSLLPLVKLANIAW
jgi:hypothetical protein